MTALVTRDGRPFEGRHALDSKGKPYFLAPRACSRCGGAGRAEKWRHTGLTCFDCQGKGESPHGPARVRLFTADEVVKLDGTKAKRDATRARKRAEEAARAQAEADDRRVAFEAAHGPLLGRCRAYLAARYGADDLAIEGDFVFDVIRRAERACLLTEKQVAALLKTVDAFEAEQARKATAGHVGTVGERLTLDLTVARSTSFDRPVFGAEWLRERVTVTTLHDPAGNAFVVKSTRFRPERGTRVKLKGTVKAHSVFRDEKQTELQRVKIVETAPV